MQGTVHMVNVGNIRRSILLVITVTTFYLIFLSFLFCFENHLFCLFCFITTAVSAKDPGNAQYDKEGQQHGPQAPEVFTPKVTLFIAFLWSARTSVLGGNQPRMHLLQIPSKSKFGVQVDHCRSRVENIPSSEFTGRVIPGKSVMILLKPKKALLV